MARTIQDFTKQKEYLVCIDSDGCAIDTMIIKHQQIFGPLAVEHFGLTHKQEEVLDRWGEINLTSSTRGINRFVGLAMLLEEFKDSIKINIDDYLHWSKTSQKHSNDLIHTYDTECFQTVLNWSKEVNEQIEQLANDDKKAFEGVDIKIEMISQIADIAIVSSANQAAIIDEWEHNKLLDKINCIATQTDGSKSHCIQQLINKGYEKNKVLMIGDALGDLKAATDNGISFYPILVNKEVTSWQKIDSYFEKFKNGNYTDCQNQLIQEFNAQLN